MYFELIRWWKFWLLPPMQHKPEKFFIHNYMLLRYLPNPYQWNPKIVKLHEYTLLVINKSFSTTYYCISIRERKNDQIINCAKNCFRNNSENSPINWKIFYSRIRTINFVYLVRWRGQLMSALAGHCLPY